MKQLHELLIISVAMFLGVVLFQFSQTRIDAQTNCDIECLNDRITALARRVAALESAGRGGGTRSTTSSAVKQSESFFQISGGSATSNTWIDVPGSTFYFDQSLYGNVVSVTWQGWMENGSGQARLYDVTNSRAVDGSTVTVSASGRASFYSQPMAIWRGQNQYILQVQNANSQMVTITTPRLRILAK